MAGNQRRVKISDARGTSAVKERDAGRTWRPDYRPGFLSPGEAVRLFEAVHQAGCWRRETVRLFGRCHAIPRSIDWYGDPGVSYRYSGNEHPARGWPAHLLALRERLEGTLATRFNFVLVNLYRDGNQAIGWHADDEASLDGVVASVSLGDRRRFLLRPPEPRVSPGPKATRSIALDLEPGSLLVLPVAERIRHCLPRTRQPVAARINLSFRQLKTPAPQTAGRSAR